MKTPTKKFIGQLLVEAGIVTHVQVAKALHEQEQRGGRLVSILFQLGYLDELSFFQFLAKQPGLAGIEVSRYHPTPALSALVPRDFAVQREVLPLDRLGRVLSAGMVCPLDTATVEDLERLTGLCVRTLLCSASDFRNNLKRYYPEPAKVFSSTIPSSPGSQAVWTAAVAAEPQEPDGYTRTSHASAKTSAELRNRFRQPISMTVGEAVRILRHSQDYAYDCAKESAGDRSCSERVGMISGVKCGACSRLIPDPHNKFLWCPHCGAPVLGSTARRTRRRMMATSRYKRAVESVREQIGSWDVDVALRSLWSGDQCTEAVGYGGADLT